MGQGQPMQRGAAVEAQASPGLEVSCFFPGTVCQNKMQATAPRPSARTAEALLWQPHEGGTCLVLLPGWEEAAKLGQGSAAPSCSLAGTRQGRGEPLGWGRSRGLLAGGCWQGSAGSPGCAAHAGKCPAGTGRPGPSLLLVLTSVWRAPGAVEQVEVLQLISVLLRCQLYLLDFTHQ